MSLRRRATCSKARRSALGTRDWLHLTRTRFDWRLEDLLVNHTDETLTISARVNESAKFNFTLPLANANVSRALLIANCRAKIAQTSRFCSIRLLNSSLLIFCIISIVVWLVLLTIKLHRVLLKDCHTQTVFTRRLGGSPPSAAAAAWLEATSVAVGGGGGGGGGNELWKPTIY